MHHEKFFYAALVYLAAAVISVPLAKRMGLGSVPGYLLAGMAIGPFGMGLLGEDTAEVMGFAEFGVVMMLFLVGLELEPKLLWRLRGPIFGLGGMQVVVTTVLVGGVAMMMGLSWQGGVAAGLTLAMSSTAIVLQTLGEKGEMNGVAGRQAFAVLLFQDLAVIPVLALLPLLGEPGVEAGSGMLAGLPVWVRGVMGLGAVAAVVAGGRFLVQPVLRWIAQSELRELFTAASLLLVIGIALLMHAVGLSPALGAFLAGVVLAESEYRHELEADLAPFKGLLLGLFFISVGSAMDLGALAARPWVIAGITVGLMALKAGVLWVIGGRFGMATADRSTFALSLAQGGEFGFVLVTMALSGKILGEEDGEVLQLGIALSMALTPLLFLFDERVVRPRVSGKEETEGREADVIDEKHAVLVIGYGRFGHIVGRVMETVGIPCTVLDSDSEQVELLRKIGFKVYYGDATRLELLHAAGAGQAKLAVVTLASVEKSLEIVRLLQRHFPQLRILVRVRGRLEAYELLDAGVEDVFRETLDASLEMAVAGMRHLGVPGHTAVRAVRQFRRHDEGALRRMAAVRHDRAAYLSEARQSVRVLEEVLRSDAVREERDDGWNPEK